jgi:hypothetical protein
LRANSLNARTVTPVQIEEILRNKSLDLSGFYVDTSLVLRSEGEPNAYLARNLIQQIKERAGRKPRLPRMIPLAGLDLREDSDSNYGLAYDLTDEFEAIYAAILDSPTGNFSPEDMDRKKGVPRALKEGDRTLWTRSEGLSRLCLGRYRKLNSYWYDLGDSYPGGRVVLESGEATSPKNS